MAVFAFIALNTFGDLLTFGSALWSVGVCGGSWSECRSQLAARRRERLFEELLERCYRDNENGTGKEINMSSESIDSCDFAYPEGTASPGSVSLDKSSATDVVYREESITEVSPGLCFVVAGTVLLTCERFSVNLMLKNDDIALHVNPRLPQNYIVRNCRVKRCWGREEVASPLAFNLHRGHRFNVQILVTDDEFLICVNGRHCNTFKHRLPYRKICALEVRGDVRDVAVEQCYMECYPQLELELIQQRSPEEQRAIGGERLACDEKSCKPMPYTGVLREPFTDGKKLHIYGRVKLLPHSFYVNLQTSGYVWPHPNILFHLNPRFGSVGGRHVICRNSWRNGKWEREERSENMSDFMPGKPFHLQIDCTDGSYQVSLNGNLKAEFLHRDNPRLAEAIYIQGDIKVYDVFVENAY